MKEESRIGYQCSPLVPGGQSRASSKCVDTGELPVEQVPVQDKDGEGIHKPAPGHREHLCPPFMRPGVQVREGTPCLRTTRRVHPAESTPFSPSRLCLRFGPVTPGDVGGQL